MPFDKYGILRMLMDKLKRVIKSPLFNLILLIFITVLVYSQLLGSNFDVFIDSIKNANKIYLFVALLAQVITMLLTGYILYKVGKLFKSKLSYSLALQASFVGALGSGIMPMGSGAQLFQFYLFNKAQIETTNIAIILWIEFLLYQAGLVIVTLVLILLNMEALKQSGLMLGVIVGMFVTSFVLVGLSLLSISQSFYNLIIKCVTKIYSILPIKKDVTVFENKLNNQVVKFQESLELFANNKRLIVQLVLVNIVRMGLFLSVSYFVARSFGLNDLSIVSILGGHIFVMMHNSFIPIPGQSGTTEYFFNKFLGRFYQSFTTSIVIVWRFITYYFVLIIGAFIFMFYKFRGRRTQG